MIIAISIAITLLIAYICWSLLYCACNALDFDYWRYLDIIERSALIGCAIFFIGLVCLFFSAIFMTVYYTILGIMR